MDAPLFPCVRLQLKLDEPREHVLAARRGPAPGQDDALVGLLALDGASQHFGELRGDGNDAFLVALRLLLLVAESVRYLPRCGFNGGNTGHIVILFLCNQAFSLSVAQVAGT